MTEEQTTPPPPENARQLAIDPLSILAAVLFGARHKTYAPVPNSPGTKKIVDRIFIEVLADEGAAVAIVDPALVFHFMQTHYQFDFELIEVPGALAPNNKAFRLMFRQATGSSLLDAAGNPVLGKDPAAIEKLKMVLG